MGRIGHFVYDGSPRAVGVRLVTLAAVLATGAIMAPICEAESGSVRDPRRGGVLDRAFRNRYDLDSVQRIRLTVRNRAGAQREHVVEIATKRIGGRLHSLGRFVEPADLRGTSILVIENRDRSDDHFVYFPYMESVRRLGSSQRSDAFMGTDLSYEDFERRRAEDFRVIESHPESLDDEEVVLVMTTPRYESGYARTEFAIASSDFAILRIRHFKEAAATVPAKVLRSPRSMMSRQGGHTIPHWMEVTDLRRRTTTEVHVDQIDVNPRLPDELFSTVSLQLRKRIPFEDQSDD